MCCVSQTERQLPEVVDQVENREPFHCPGISEPHLQTFARLPPAEPDSAPPQYYLHATYKQCDDRMTCTTTIRSHGCESTVGSAGELCHPCSIMADKGHTLYMKVALALHVGRVVQLYTMHQNLLRFSCWVCSLPIHHTWKLAFLEVVRIAHGRKGTRTTQEIWLTFHVGCIEGMAEKGHTIHENLACFTCWMYSRVSNTLYIEDTHGKGYPWYVEHQPLRTVRSRHSILLSVPETRLRTYGDRAFPHAAPIWWNLLPLAT